MTTCEDCRGVITANTEAQLSQKSWAELGKWHRLSLWKSWFDLSATALVSTDPEHVRTWRLDAVAWSEKSVESFAGLHNAGKRIIVLFDEASSIPASIWEVVEGALTDEGTQVLWGAFGNPTRPDGRFFQCFNRFRHRWITRQIDSRTVRITNKAQLAQWVEDHGEDSDFCRVRIKGQFPRAGSLQFIGPELAEAATKRAVTTIASDPLVMGVDVARFGDDQSVLWFRRGRDGRSIPPVCLRNVDTMQLAARVADEAARRRVDAVFIDGGGIGAGVVDRCLQMNVHGVTEVQFGGRADRSLYGGEVVRCKNKRAEMWASLREWLAGGGIPDRPELIADLTGPEFSFDMDNQIVLESKQEMKRRGLASPDLADALALTFAQPVVPAAWALAVRPRERRVWNPHANL